MLTMPTSVTPTLSGGRTETVGQIGEFKAVYSDEIELGLKEDSREIRLGYL
jgi:hypothetical protein